MMAARARREQRWIILVDLDAFFCSVEELLDPTLAGKPVIVGGDPRYRGVVSSASYAARAYGVRSAMPMGQAMRLCPQAVVITPRHNEYGRRSGLVMQILKQYTPLVEQVSIDEAFMDVTGCERLFGSPYEIALQVQQRILLEQGLPASLGVASNKLVAKIACEVGKPRGLVMVPAGQEEAFLAPLPVGRLWGVGKVTGARLHDLGVQTIGDLAGWSEERLKTSFGEGGRHLWFAARGRDYGEMQDWRERRSISQERTFARDVCEGNVIYPALLRMSENVAAHLRAEHLVALTVRIKLRAPDFTTNTRQARLPQPTDQGQVIHQVARGLLDANWRPGRPLRLLGVGASGLLDDSGYQLSLLDNSDQRRIQLNKTLDDICRRFGDHAITRASLLGNHREDTTVSRPIEQDP